jgi:hypothetical protein
MREGWEGWEGGEGWEGWKLTCVGGECITTTTHLVPHIAIRTYEGAACLAWADTNTTGQHLNNEGGDKACRTML